MHSHIFYTCKEREQRKVGGDFLELYGACVQTFSARKGRAGVSEGGSKREGAGRERAGGTVSEGGCLVSVCLVCVCLVCVRSDIFCKEGEGRSE